MTYWKWFIYSFYVFNVSKMEFGRNLVKKNLMYFKDLWEIEYSDGIIGMVRSWLSSLCFLVVSFLQTIISHCGNISSALEKGRKTILPTLFAIEGGKGVYGNRTRIPREPPKVVPYNHHFSVTSETLGTPWGEKLIIGWHSERIYIY